MTGPAPVTAATVRSAPKAVLHDHLDGGLRPTTVLELADEIGHALPERDPAALQAWFTRGADTKDILQYLATFEHTSTVMQTPEGLQRVAHEAAVDLAADGVVYAEVRFAPELHQAKGMSLDAVVEAVQDGFRSGMAASAAADRPIVVNTIVCAMRTEQRSPEIATLAARWRDRDPRVVAFDLAGAETGWPPSLHAEALAFAREHLLHLTIHASEPPDLELIHGALVQGAERIGHGVRLMADVTRTQGPDGQPLFGPLARIVRERQVCLELAPTCNVQIGAVPTLADHPVGPFLQWGFNVTVNTDNRLMSGVTVGSEVLACAQTFGWGWEQIEQVTVNAVRSGFGDHDERMALLRNLVAPAYAALRQGSPAPGATGHR
jgi:adenosine deaminase